MSEPHPPHRDCGCAECAPSFEPDAGLLALFREALAWGKTYGPEIPAHQWEEMRESMAEQYTERASRERATPRPRNK